MKLFFNTVLCIAAAGAGIAGCGGSVPPPNDQWSAAQVEVGRAQAVAPPVPDAKLHLQLAEEDLQKSKALIGQDNKRAASLIAVATVEAQLATTLARAADADAQAKVNQAALQKAGGGATAGAVPGGAMPAGTASPTPGLVK